MFTATAVLAAAHGVLVVSGPVGLIDPEAGLNSFPIITLGCVLGALIGALIAARQPRNPIGWLFLGGQLGTAIGLVSQAYAFQVLQGGVLGPPLAGQLATVVASALGASWALSVLAGVPAVSGRVAAVASVACGAVGPSGATGRHHLEHRCGGADRGDQPCR
jgi:hypothetical protein